MIINQFLFFLLINSETEGLLYAPGIADKCKYTFFMINLKLKL